MKPDDVNFVYHLKYDFDIKELNRIKDDTVKNEVNYRFQKHCLTKTQIVT